MLHQHTRNPQHCCRYKTKEDDTRDGNRFIRLSFAGPAADIDEALRRLGQPIDMARSVLLLASDEADFITGHGLVADGGLTLRT